MRLNAWKMKPISRLRMRARYDSFKLWTGWAFSTKVPSDGESRSPRMARSVDLPHPDGPDMETYSPRLISMWIPASACVSTSSVMKTLVTPSRCISVGCPDSFISPLSLVQSNSVVLVLRGHVGQNHLVATLQSIQNLYVVN